MFGELVTGVFLGALNSKLQLCPMKYSSGISEALAADVEALTEVMRDAESSCDLWVTQERWYPVGQEGGLAASVSTSGADACRLTLTCLGSSWKVGKS